MFIEKIHIDTFGKLSDLDIEPTPGINIIEGANESGKSTVAAFIKFVLYGVNSREREEMLSWESGGAAGSLTVSVDSRRLRIERAVIGSREAVQLINAENNMPVRHVLDDTTPGELLLGVDADMFSATAFISQLGAMTPGGAKVSEGIENILFSADESVNTQRALSKLDSARAALLHKNGKGGRLYELDNRCAELEIQLSESLRIHEEILNKKAQLSDNTDKLKDASEKATVLSGKIEQFEIRALLKLFARKRALEKKVAELRTKLDAAGSDEMEQLERLRSCKERYALLKKECGEAAEKEAGCSVNELSDRAKEYRELGGREMLETKLETCRTKTKVFTVIGVLALIFGIAVSALGIRPIINGGAPHAMLTVIGGVMTAIAATLFVLGIKAGKDGTRVTESYDFDELDREIKEHGIALENERFTALAAEDAKRRLDELCAEISDTCGCEPDGLGEKIDGILAKMQVSDGIEAEYDKHSSLLAQMTAQLGQYNEDELRAREDSSVDITDIDIENLSAMRREAEFSQKMVSSLEKHCNELEKELAALTPSADDPTAVTDRLNELKNERSGLKKKHDAYKLAHEMLTRASEELRESVSPRLAEEAAGYMARITDGKYTVLGVGGDLTMSAETVSGSKPIGALSAGTQDSAYLSLRLALISLLYRKSKPPVIYDESFVKQDDTRLVNHLRLVYEQNGQSFIFTSNGREAAAMSAVGDFNRIQL